MDRARTDASLPAGAIYEPLFLFGLEAVAQQLAGAFDHRVRGTAATLDFGFDLDGVAAVLDVLDVDELPVPVRETSFGEAVDRPNTSRTRADADDLADAAVGEVSAGAFAVGVVCAVVEALQRPFGCGRLFAVGFGRLSEPEEPQPASVDAASSVARRNACLTGGTVLSASGRPGVGEELNRLVFERGLPEVADQPLDHPRGHERRLPVNELLSRFAAVVADAVSRFLELPRVAICWGLAAVPHGRRLAPVLLFLEPFTKFRCACRVHWSPK